MATDGGFLANILPNISGSGGLIDIALAIILGVLVLGVCAGGLYWWIKKRKSWNLKVEFRLPRNIRSEINEDGIEIITGTIKKEWGKGYYNAKGGVVYVKRNKNQAVPMKPFNVKEILSDNNILTVIQVGIEDYRPVLEDSYLNVEDYETQEVCALIKAKIDTSESKSWKSSYERERKATFTLSSWMAQHGQLIGFGFIIMSIFVGFAVLYSKLK